MRMRGLEPPPRFQDTDLNSAVGLQMRPRGSRPSVLSGSADASDTSCELSVATVLPRQTGGGYVSDGSEHDSLVVEDGDDLELAAERVHVACDGGQARIGSALKLGDVRL